MTNIEASYLEFCSLPSKEWRKDFFSWETGGFVATHVLKAKDAVKRPGIAKEVEACLVLAKMGKHVLRLPENVLDKIDTILINGKPYRELLKFKPGFEKPRGYPDVYFDGQTWDFKTSTFRNEDSLRQTIKDGRKADNIIILSEESSDFFLKAMYSSIGREFGSREKDGSWMELPNVYLLTGMSWELVWTK